jgi:hypothetical protein
MISLEEQQRGLLLLLKNRSVSTDGDQYLCHVAASEELILAREIAIWWRALGIEQNCPNLSMLLKRLNCFESSVEAFYGHHTASPFMEEMAAQFLDVMSSNADPLIASMSSFERAVLNASQGDVREFEISWDRSPEDVFAALRNNLPLPPPDGCHRVTVAWRPCASASS